ncbi:hypothetical protein [Falsiphaeobacter marinintestinus]|uniref:hypothetical protein n=1 Tax=Falsiphaeobacter marinintestinus TaxID=1492905 RepID=UPI0011B43D69|nr:hypothetical protein [Phaeobacter marinintestinus]
MKKVFAVTALTIAGLAGAAYADALDDARERGVCGVGFEPISAEYLADGRLSAVCPPGSGAAAAAAGSTIAGSTAGAAGALGGTALAGGGAIAAGVLGLAAIVAIAGSDDSTSGTTTTTTTTTTN